MKSTVHFEHVSKKYQLGLTRTSLPSVVSGWVRNSLQGGSRQLNKDKTFWALRDVSFELKQGESLALVGSNGAGKTTILKLLANITKPTSGKIEVNGQLSALIELGAGFHPDLTGRENIYLNGTILGLSRKQVADRFDEIVEFSELGRFIDTPVKRYSSGMTVRLGFAVASCMEPQILLVDEVLAVGDASFQQKCMSRIRSLINNNGTSIIFVSHNFYLVQAVCSSALYLEKGQVKFRGETNEVIERYEHDLHQARALKFESQDHKPGDDEASDLEITKVEVSDPGGTVLENLPNKQPAQIQIHYNAYKPMGKAHVSVFIRRSDGLTVCMMRTKLDDYEVYLEQGQGIISLHLEPLQLTTGTYFAEAWFLNESDSMAIIPKGGRSAWFSVKGSALSYADDSGIFEPNTRWSHHFDLLTSSNGSGFKKHTSNSAQVELRQD
ncbi:MAG: ABC transporter ATP-binding protein [Anaerolineales bacterium]|nr:ABC transporter ATP-binding protein [Anaerolineales bacterium]